jgi:glycosyltransferase involved in cell wall biosynthesis
MPAAWLLYDDGDTGHHPGYIERVTEAVAKAGIRPIVAAPARPPSLVRPDDWIEVEAHPHRAVHLTYSQIRRVARRAASMGVDTFVDLYLDKNIWGMQAAGGIQHRVHILHHAEQYRLDSRRGLAGVRTRFLRHQLATLSDQGATVVVHTPRAAEIIRSAVTSKRLVMAGYPVPSATTRVASPPSDPPVVLFTGAGRREKGLESLIAALSLLEHEVRLRVVGKQPEGLIEYLDPDRSPLIEWIDRRVTDEELWAEYNGASLAVLPYQPVFGEHGGPSSVLLEVIARGVPVVTTPALADQLPPGGQSAVVAASHTPSSLAAAIDAALGRLADLSETALRTGPEFIRRSHSYDAYVATLASIVSRPDSDQP